MKDFAEVIWLMIEAGYEVFSPWEREITALSPTLNSWSTSVKTS